MKLKGTKYIVVPKNQEAAYSLIYNVEDDKSQLIELYIDNDDFLSLEDIGVFEEMNVLLNLEIDNYEDTEITSIFKIKGCLHILELYLDKYIDSKLSKLLTSLIKLFEEAYLRETGVYFFL